MSKKNIEVLERDDEVLRERGMTSGPTSAARWTLRTSAAREISWMQTGKVIRNDWMDEIWRASAYVYLHTAPTPEILKAIVSEESFIAAVYDWMAKENPSKKDLEEVMPSYSQRVGEWYSSTSETTESGPNSGN